MKYQPITCVWEVTMGCNMRCGHCGSSCTQALPDELTTKEAFDVCDQLAQLGLYWVTLSGGEPLTRKDTPELVKRLSEQNVSVNIITNGWLLDEAMAKKLKDNGIATVAISIDGTREIHNQIRKDGAFEHAETAFSVLKSLGIKTGAVTTITKQNIDILPDLKEELIRMGVDTWQVQLGLPMGNLREKPDWLLEPEQVSSIIDFCYDTALEKRIKIFPADCIGYYTKKEMTIKKISYGTEFVSLWDGCNAGTRGFGILHNGDILGCTSIRNREYIEGNLRERSLKDIWEDENSFLWRRKMTKEQLKGECRNCTYGSKCLGGCPNTRLTMNETMDSENQYCAYNLHLKKLKEKYAHMTNTKQLFQIADLLIQNGIYQEAIYALKKLLSLDSSHKQALLAKAYAEYHCGNYDACKEDNEKVLAMDSQNGDALSGYALAVYRLGNREEGIVSMRKALNLTSTRKSEMLYDLAQMEAGL